MCRVCYAVDVVGRGDATIDDLDMAFREIGINVKEMTEYRKNVEPIHLPHAVPEYPVEPQVPPLFIPEIDDEGKIVMPTPVAASVGKWPVLSADFTCFVTSI